MLTLRLGFALMMSFSGGVIGLVVGNVIQSISSPARTLAWSITFMGVILGLMIGLTSDDSVVSSPEALKELQEKRIQNAQRLTQIRFMYGVVMTLASIGLLYAASMYSIKQPALWSMEGVPSVAGGLLAASFFGRGLGIVMASLRPVALASLVLIDEFVRKGPSQLFYTSAIVLTACSLIVGTFWTWRTVSILRNAPQELHSIVE